MKKIYTALALGVALSATAFAAPYNTNRVKTFVPVDQVKTEMVSVQKAEMKAESMTEETRAAADMFADYELLYYCNLLAEGSTTQAKGYLGQFLHIINDGGTYKLLGLAYDFEAIVTLQDNSFSVAPQNLGSDTEDGSTYQYELRHFRWNDDGQGFYEKTDPIVFAYNEDYGIYAPDNYDILAIQAIVDGVERGYFFMGYGLEAYKMPNTINNEGWKDAGVAKFTDGFVSVTITADASPLTWDVPVQVSEETPTIVRLVNPYAAGVAPDDVVKYNSSTAPGCIYLNIANSTSVYVIPGFYSGMYIAPLYVAIYPTNLPAYYKYYEEMEDEDIVDGFGAEERAVLEDKTVTVPLSGFGDCPYYKLTMQNGSKLTTPFEFYTWTTEEGDEIEAISEIVLPAEALSGVEEIGAEEMNAPVKYYNLQGVEIAAPAKGELVIKKQGSKAIKAIVR